MAKAFDLNPKKIKQYQDDVVLKVKYDKNSDSATWYNEIRSQLEEFVKGVLSQKIGQKLVVSYSQKPNRQNGQGRGFVHKHYILTGFVPETLLNNKYNAFIKLEFRGFNGSDISFAIEIDVDHKKSQVNINDKKTVTIPIDTSFPSDFDTLADKIKDECDRKIHELKYWIDSQNAEKGNTQNTDKMNNDNTPTPTTMNTHPLNLILYGPPGTGKTYNTVNEALDIIKPKWREEDEYQNAVDEEAKRKFALNLFNKYKKDGQIVFTTFHQSLSYEEFIEGIKPINGDTSIVIKHNNANTTGTNQFGEGFSTIDDLSMMRYDVKPGIFKDICLKAAQNFQSNFDECYEEFIKDIAEEEYFELQTSKQSKFYVSVNRNNNLKLYTTENKNLNGVLTKENIYLTHLGKLDYWKGYMQGVIKYLKDTYHFTDSPNEKKDPYVLIIDEINRGNVSQIFGELITLIEEDKRTTKWDKDKNQYVDNPEKITVKLPYSPDEEPFGVPGNLYIIGTMNTADRSVEALDTALRRRFDFKEMMPNPKLLDEQDCKKDWQDDLKDLLENKVNKSLKEILETINNRIRVLKDREHQIGHSYFMKCKTVEDLKNVFKNNIVPLLQEYFYGNYAYIGLVLGNRFVLKDEEANNPKFATFDGKDSFENNTDTQYKLLDEKGWRELDMEAALQQLIGQ